MSKPMREWIARAICEADGYGSEPDPETAKDWERHKSIGWPYPCKAGWLRYQDHADAVLAELETPTVGMLNEAYGNFSNYVEEEFRDAWYAAIRAALEGK